MPKDAPWGEPRVPVTAEKGEWAEQQRPGSHTRMHHMEAVQWGCGAMHEPCLALIPTLDTSESDLTRPWTHRQAAAAVRPR